jgi:hypothetical protein
MAITRMDRACWVILPSAAVRAAAVVRLQVPLYRPPVLRTSAMSNLERLRLIRKFAVQALTRPSARQSSERYGNSQLMAVPVGPDDARPGREPQPWPLLLGRILPQGSFDPKGRAFT